MHEAFSEKPRAAVELPPNWSVDVDVKLVEEVFDWRYSLCYPRQAVIFWLLVWDY